MSNVLVFIPEEMVIFIDIRQLLYGKRQVHMIPNDDEGT